MLLHTLPNGCQHYDWLIARTADPVRDAPIDARVLLSFRLDLLPDWARFDHPFDAVRIGDHRARYLTYEGEVSGGGGGRVERVAEGMCLIDSLDDTDGYARVRVRLSGSNGLVLSAVRLEIDSSTANANPPACVRSDDVFDRPYGIWRFGMV